MGQVTRTSIPPDIVSHAVWLYHRFCLSFGDVEERLAQRGVTVTYETIRRWCQRFGPVYARRLRRRGGGMGDTWHLDEVFVTIQGRRQYLWRAVDKAGADLLFGFISQRYERRSLVVTTNLPFARWSEVFLDATAAAAVIDRIVHHATVLTTAGDSYRLKVATRNQASRATQEVPRQ